MRQPAGIPELEGVKPGFLRERPDVPFGVGYRASLDVMDFLSIVRRAEDFRSSYDGRYVNEADVSGLQRAPHQRQREDVPGLSG